jgi:Holliday junction resolvase RusA-like endonuclease
MESMYAPDAGKKNIGSGIGHKMPELHITIPGNVVSKKNSRRCFGGKAVASKAFLAYEKTCLQELQYMRKKWEGTYPVELHCFFYRKTKQKFDYSNLVESIQDILVKAGVIEDDSYRHVIPVVGGMEIDKDHPRVSIRIVQI